MAPRPEDPALTGYLKLLVEEHLKASGQTQAELARGANVSKPKIGALLKGHGSGPKVLEGVARVLGRDTIEIRREAAVWWEKTGRFLPPPDDALAAETIRGRDDPDYISAEPLAQALAKQTRRNFSPEAWKRAREALFARPRAPIDAAYVLDLVEFVARHHVQRPPDATDPDAADLKNNPPEPNDNGTPSPASSPSSSAGGGKQPPRKRPPRT